MSPPSWNFLPPPNPSPPSRLSQSPSLSSLSHAANSHWVSVLHGSVYVCMVLSPWVPPSPPPPRILKVCFMCLCLYCCSSNKFIGTIVTFVFMSLFFVGLNSLKIAFPSYSSFEILMHSVGFGSKHDILKKRVRIHSKVLKLTCWKEDGERTIYGQWLKDTGKGQAQKPRLKEWYSTKEGITFVLFFFLLDTSEEEWGRR